MFDWTNTSLWLTIFVLGGLVLLWLRRRAAAQIAWLDWCDRVDAIAAERAAIHRALHAKDASGSSAWERCFGREHGDLP